MTERARRRVGFLLLAALAYVPVLASSAGRVAADTKQYLYLDPSRLLSRAWSMWDPNIGFGTVTHQNIGYLFPMGPFYWSFQALGVPDWVAQRLWLGSILFAAATGMLFLFRTIGVRGAGAVLGALLFMLSPYSLDYAARISVILLPWAGLPWLLGIVIRGLRRGGWWHAAWFALAIQFIGGVNATALVFVGLAPAIWIVHSVAVTREVRLRRAIGTVMRFGALTFAASTWWMAGLWAQGSYGINILKFTETLRAVSRTSLPNEVLRGLGYWFFYGKDKLGSWIEASPVYTQRPFIILVSYGIPCLALAGAAFITWKYRSFFVATIVAGVVIAVGAHPYDSPTPLGGWFKHAANSSTIAFALRSTGRATPLVILGIAALFAAGMNAVLARFGAVHWRVLSLRVAVPAAAGLLIVVNLPALWDGTFYGGNLQRDEAIPKYWTDATHYLDQQRHDTRVMELPGADFASYRWGNTVDPITPGLIDRPYVARELIPYGSPASANLLNAFDLRIQDRSLPASALEPMARLTGVGDYVLRNDLQFERYHVLRPEFLESLFTPTPPGLQHAASFGKPNTAQTTQYPFNDEQALGATTRLPTPRPVDVYRVKHPSPIVRATASDRPVVMSGDGDGIVDLASIGALASETPVLDSAAFNRAGILDHVRAGSPLVVTDTNRLRARRWSTITDTVGYTEGPGNHPIAFDESDARLDMFPSAPKSAATTVELHGARRVGASSYGNPITYNPEDRPARAFDGDVLTAWRTGAFDDVRGERILVEAQRPITTNHVNLVQVMRPPRGRWITRAVLRFNGGAATTIDLGPASRTIAGETIRFPKRTFSTFTIEILDTNLGPLRNYGGVDPVGFAEIRLQGDGADEPVQPLHIDEVTVLPTDLTQAVGTASAGHPLAYVMSRERVIPVPPRRDPELAMARQISTPTARSFGIGAEVRLSSWAPDDLVDRLLGYRGDLRIQASDHLAGAPRYRASASLDADPSTAWVTPFEHVVGQTLSMTLPAPRTLDRLDLQLVADGLHSVPRRIDVRNEAGETRTVDIPAVVDAPTPNATVAAPVAFPALRGSTFTVRIAAIREVRTHEWYCECDQIMPVGIAELGVPELAPVRVAAEIPGECRADLISVDSHPVDAKVVGSTAAALALDPLRVQACRGSARPKVQTSPGSHIVGTSRGDRTGWNVDRIVFASDRRGRARALGSGALISLRDTAGPPSRAARPAGTAARTRPRVDVIESGRSNVRAVVTGATGPFWLVLGQSVNAGWRATVDGKELGASTLVNGFANGWRVNPSGTSPLTVELDWTPQRTVNLALGVSLAGVLACFGVVVVLGARRRRGQLPELSAVTTPSTEPIFVLPWQRSATRPGAIALAIGVIIGGGAAALIVSPAIGLLTAVVALIALRWPPGRVALRLAPAIALAGCGAFIAAKQVYANFPAAFEWPTFFSEVRTLGWMVVVLLLVDAVVEALVGAADRRSVRP